MAIEAKIETTPDDIRRYFKQAAAGLSRDKWQSYRHQKKLRADIRMISSLEIPDLPGHYPMPPGRTFGPEIEGFFIGSLSRGQCQRRLYDVLKEVGADRWRIKREDYLSAPFAKVADLENLTFEVVAPILEGESGLAEYHRVAEALYQAGFRANESCGLHLHVGVGKREKMRARKNLVRATQKNRDTLISYLAHDRRNNAYCKPNPILSDDEIDDIADEHALIWTVNPPPNRCSISFDRNYLLNLHPLEDLGTAEWRAKEGRAFRKAKGYIRQMVCFTDRALKDPNAVLPTRQELARLAALPQPPLPDSRPEQILPQRKNWWARLLRPL